MIKKKPKKKSKAKLAAIEKRKRLAEWSIKIRERDGCCIVCGSKLHLQAHHLCPKMIYKNHIYDIMNGVILCAGHHMWGKQSAERNALWWADWLSKNRPAQYKYAMEIING